MLWTNKAQIHNALDNLYCIIRIINYTDLMTNFQETCESWRLLPYPVGTGYSEVSLDINRETSFLKTPHAVYKTDLNIPL